ncbi:secondary thiamine-phosphate synthase enzyme YjbQ [Marinitoga sp. 38H-ov]|uniref:secondary thiamine-phosphate synthase enzyme YjbQ n=1 Tax=Marinitoga sp. 38H-ov TaxID=1755814 RepID=UPI0013E9EB8E|nr:secondary thiamine-phosphate synthase enzyme YjbQ [Marinitoga sp. 38H-ov]KAF2957023.1 secondary thiamine-phosphate synthase enzyme [Marinitoga sp. 38H-ov]
MSFDKEVFGNKVKSVTKYLWFNTKNKIEIIHLTNEVNNFVRESNIIDGYVMVSAMHLTASIYINDYESGLMEDIKEWLEKLAPENYPYKHHRTGEINGHAHLKNLLMHHQVIVPITNGELDLGPWQEIFYAEFDGQRRKRVILKAFGITKE